MPLPPCKETRNKAKRWLKANTKIVSEGNIRKWCAVRSSLPKGSNVTKEIWDSWSTDAFTKGAMKHWFWMVSTSGEDADVESRHPELGNFRVNPEPYLRPDGSRLGARPPRRSSCTTAGAQMSSLQAPGDSSSKWATSLALGSPLPTPRPGGEDASLYR